MNDVASAFFVSIRVASLSTLCVLPVAVLCALLLERLPLAARHITELLLMLPLWIPPLAIGYLALQLFPTLPAQQAAILAAVLMSLPIAVRCIVQSLRAIPVSLHEQAQLAGASRARILWYITLPLCWPGIISAALLSWMRALGEFGATMVLAGNVPGESQTLALSMWTHMQIPGGESAIFVLIALSLILGVCGLVMVELILPLVFRRRLGILS